MADKTDDLDTDALRIGDYVLFKDVVRGLYLGAEGILLEDLVATDGISLQDSLFCVHLQRQYSASRDLLAFLSNYDMDEKRIEDESGKKYLLALRVRYFAIFLIAIYQLNCSLSLVFFMLFLWSLQRGLVNEKKLNDTYMRKKHGQKVAFGDIIQVISGSIIYSLFSFSNRIFNVVLLFQIFVLISCFT